MHPIVPLRRASAFLFLFLLELPGLQSQVRADVRHLGERIFAVVPLTGSGTYADPRRPAMAPTDAELRSQTGILSYRWTPSDDGRFAVVEYVVRSRAAVATLRGDQRAVKVFHKGRDKKDDVEKELRKYRKDFSVDGPEVKKP